MSRILEKVNLLSLRAVPLGPRIHGILASNEVRLRVKNGFWMTIQESWKLKFLEILGTKSCRRELENI